MFHTVVQTNRHKRDYRTNNKLHGRIYDDAVYDLVLVMNIVKKFNRKLQADVSDSREK